MLHFNLSFLGLLIAVLMITNIVFHTLTFTGDYVVDVMLGYRWLVDSINCGYLGKFLDPVLHK